MRQLSSVQQKLEYEGFTPWLPVILKLPTYLPDHNQTIQFNQKKIKNNLKQYDLMPRGWLSGRLECWKEIKMTIKSHQCLLIIFLLNAFQNQIVYSPHIFPSLYLTLQIPQTNRHIASTTNTRLTDMVATMKWKMSFISTATVMHFQTPHSSDHDHNMAEIVFSQCSRFGPRGKFLFKQQDQS